MPAAPVCDHLEEILKPFQQAYILLSLSWFMCVRIDVKITKNIFFIIHPSIQKPFKAHLKQEHSESTTSQKAMALLKLWSFMIWR